VRKTLFRAAGRFYAGRWLSGSERKTVRCTLLTECSG
jgi:hypothetical protein